jgi:hypothetical protein
MRFHGATRHFQLARDFGVVTALQKQFNDLLFAWAEPNGLFIHYPSPLLSVGSGRPKQCNSAAAVTFPESIASTMPL